MSNNPFVILGVSKDASQSEILEAYKTKRAYYQEHVFDEGESGAEATRMLGVLDNAYQEAMEMSHESATVSGEGESSLNSVREALKNKDINRAQAALDNITYRSGEWHYLQSVVFYEKGWLNDSKKQLELALQLDPGNAKYDEALNKLRSKIDGAHPFREKSSSEDVYANNARSYNTMDPTDTCCATCQTLYCMDCCCECMGGDLIPCC